MYLTAINKPTTTNPFRDIEEKNNVISASLKLPNISSPERRGEMKSILGALSMTF